MIKILKDRLRAYGLAGSLRRIAREAAAMTSHQRDELLQRAAGKTMVFTVASGRSGTQALAKIFEAAPGVHATHEGSPAFHDVMRQALSKPSLARDFLLTRKLPAVVAAPEPVYFESSHVFGKGFLPPMLSLGLRPKLLFLKRHPRQVALSLERIGATPLRTTGGQTHFLSPADPSMLPMQQWDDFTDYQLCFWYAVETVRRQRLLHQAAVRVGCQCRYLRIEDLRTVTDAWTLMSQLGIDAARTPAADAALKARVGQVFNHKYKRPPLSRPAVELVAQERTVIERIQASLPELNVRDMLTAYVDEPAPSANEPADLGVPEPRCGLAGQRQVLPA